jgi:hypothetical protein
MKANRKKNPLLIYAGDIFHGDNISKHKEIEVYVDMSSQELKKKIII